MAAGVLQDRGAVTLGTGLGMLSQVPGGRIPALMLSPHGLTQDMHYANQSLSFVAQPALSNPELFVCLKKVTLSLVYNQTH